MLWFKVWCETRARLAIAAAALVAVCVAALGGGADWRRAGDAPQTCFLLLASVLGGGSLRQERALGTLGFTLALPVPWARHVVVRAAVGLAEIVALAAIAALVTRTPWIAVTWTAVGALGLGLALACATVIVNEYAAWLAGFGAVMGYELAVNLSSLRGDPALDLYRLMTDGAIGAPVAWPSLAGAVAAGAAILAAAAWASQRREL
jgi:hypothetical protein